MECPKFTLKEVDLHKWRIFFQDSLIGETSFPVPSEKIGKCIVQAINCHEKLVEVCKMIKEDKSFILLCEHCRYKTEQALKQAEKP